MRRLVSLLTVLFFAVPFGISVSGCSKAAPAQFCNGNNAGLQLGQTTQLTLDPRATGISLNQGEIGQLNNVAGTDCRGNTTSVAGVRYGSSDVTLVDVVPTTGRICAGIWNRNTGGSIPDFTTCTPNGRQGTAFVTGSGEGVTSNPLPVYVHPVVTSIVLGSASSDCTNDPASNCYNTTVLGACATGNPNTPPSYDGTSCVSQNGAAQLAARVLSGTQNISCSVGPLTFSAQTGSVVSIDQNGLATASAPGATIINANTSQSSSTAGFFSTCPPKTIVLTTPGSTTAPTSAISVNQNVMQNLVATVTDTNNKPITNVQLTYVSTSPTVVPVAGGTVTPAFPGAAAITAICEPPSCNPSPLNLQGLYANGLPTFSNPVQIVAPGTSSTTILYIASSQSQYVQPIDFTVNTQSPPLRLPFAPNSFVLSQDLSSIYMGTDSEIMVLSVSTNGISLVRQDTSIMGKVLAVSPDSGTVIVTDPKRNLIYLYQAGGGISSEYGGTGISAQWSPDSQFVYITTTDGRLLVHSTFNGWTSVALPNSSANLAVTVPSAGVYLSSDATGRGTVTAHTDCPNTTTTGTGLQQTTTNNFFPVADTTPAVATNLAATNDGVHILGASNTTFTDLSTNQKTGGCPIAFTSTVAATLPFTVAAPTLITNVLPTSDSAYSFVTYQGTGGVVPQYAPGTKALTNIPLQKTASGTPIAPVSGVITADNNTVFVGTTGDNVVHRLTRGATGFTDTLAPIIPALPNINGGTTPATPDFLAQRPRRSTS